MKPAEQIRGHGVRPVRATWGLRCNAVATLLLAAAGALADVPGNETPVPVTRAASIDASRASMVVQERALDRFSAEGTRATAYRRGPSIAKIEVVALGERGRILLDFYWSGASLTARERRIDYGAMITSLPTDRPLPMTLMLDETLEFRGDALERRIVAGATQSTGSKEAKSRAAELAGKARSFRRLMSTPAGGTEGCRWSCAAEWKQECRRFICD